MHFLERRLPLRVQTKLFGDSRDITFCSQTSWLINGSIKENITFFTSPHEIWYNTVVKACTLAEDIASKKRGHDTYTGNEGISLSGGQRHKVAPACALKMMLPCLLRGR